MRQPSRILTDRPSCPLLPSYHMPARGGGSNELCVELWATGHKGLPDTFAVTDKSPCTGINVDTEWTFTTPHGQARCQGTIDAIRALTHDSIEYVVRGISPPTLHFFLITPRNRTNNPSAVTRVHRALKPHLRDSQRIATVKFPWANPYDAQEGRAPSTGGPVHYVVLARCVSRGEADCTPSTWRMTRATERVRIGMYVDLQDVDDPLIPIGPVRITGIHNLERSWIEFIATIHPQFNRTSCTYVRLATPLEWAIIPDNLRFAHSTMRNLLPDVHGAADIFPPPPHHPTPCFVVSKVRLRASVIRSKRRYRAGPTYTSISERCTYLHPRPRIS